MAPVQINIDGARCEYYTDYTFTFANCELPNNLFRGKINDNSIKKNNQNGN